VSDRRAGDSGPAVEPPAAAPLTPDDWRRLEPLVDALLDAPAEQRADLLAALSGGDPARRAELERLVAECERPRPLLDRPAAERFAALADDGPLRAEQVVAERYQVVRELGRGGMATVYLARDLRHQRPVAVKVLHPELAAALGPERFLREVELTASLQHPHILALFDSGSADGKLYYVMPYVDGETLRARLARERQLPAGEAVRLAREVADALQYAHARGVVHRDVKPENILLQQGHALVADFGIALAVEQAGGERMTQSGLFLGTPQYMAPEQASAERAVDARADIYALGAVTYEMLAGEPPFTGASVQVVVAKLMTEQPRAITSLRRSVPPHVEAAVMIALEKLPADRFASAAAFAAALAPEGAPTVPAGVRTVGRRAGLATAAFAAVTLAAGLALGWGAASARGRAAAAAGPARGPVRFAIQLDSGSLEFGSSPVISPDGRAVVYAADGPDGPRLYARRLDQLAARPIPGTEDGTLPFFSPDGAWVAFFSHGALRKIRQDGGTPLVVTAAPAMGYPTRWDCGWSEDDLILCAVAGAPSGGLIRVPAGGGTPSAVHLADTTSFILFTPHPLPRRNAVLVTVALARSPSTGLVGVVDLATGRVRRFGPGHGPRYVGGAIVYVSASGELLRQPFDLDRLEPTGPPEPVTNDLGVFSLGLTGFDVSGTGTLVYRPAGSGWERVKLIVTDRAGRTQRVIPSRAPSMPRFSPDGRRVAYGAAAPGERDHDVWVTDLVVGTTQRLTTDRRDANNPQWSPDGRAIAYSVNYSVDGATGKNLAVLTLDGGAARALTRRPGTQWPTDWAPDGSGVLFTDNRDARGPAGEPVSLQEIWVQPPDGSPPHPYLATPAHVRGARVSPDGHWVAYVSDETGRNEVYVQSYPTPGHKVLVSNGGGVNPVWGRGGRELYYWQADQLVAATLGAGGAGEPLTVRGGAPLFRAPDLAIGSMYDVSPDGTRFALVTSNTRTNRLVVVLNALGGGRSPARR
jgi:serine/threonine-protein kinase